MSAHPCTVKVPVKFWLSIWPSIYTVMKLSASVFHELLLTALLYDIDNCNVSCFQSFIQLCAKLLQMIPVKVPVKVPVNRFDGSPNSKEHLKDDCNYLAHRTYVIKSTFQMFFSDQIGVLGPFTGTFTGSFAVQG